jgi:GNAT superfamily N-acetyltransferase
MGFILHNSIVQNEPQTPVIAGRSGLFLVQSGLSFPFQDNMNIRVEPVRSQKEQDDFFAFPWLIYHDDPYWVPPMVDDLKARLDPKRNPFWKNAACELWLAKQGDRCVGTIVSIIDRLRVDRLGDAVGAFGFFECVDDPLAAQALLDTAGGWLKQRGMKTMRGPYNPSGEDEAGILIEGFQTRPALYEGHHPAYYQRLLESCGMVKYRDQMARLWTRDKHASFAEQMPGKLVRAASRAALRDDLSLRRLDLQRWDEEVTLAWKIYTTCLAPLPEWVPTPLEEFQAIASAFRTIVDPRLVLVAELSGKPVGFMLALPDAAEALQKVLSHQKPRPLGLWDMARLYLYTRRLSRATFKMLMILPEYQGRGVEAVLTAELARIIWEIGFREVDMSMTGEENEKSNRFQENLGFRVYRRYRIYQQELA